MRFLKIGLLLTLAITVALPSCSPDSSVQPAPAKVVFLSPEPTKASAFSFDDEALPDQPARIISLVPSTTETLFALGLGSRVIGVGRWADWPPEVEGLPRLGDITKVQIERILELQPDLVFLFDAHRDAATVLEKAGLKTVIPPTETGEKLFEGFTAVATAAGVPSRGESLVRQLKTALHAIQARAPDGPRPRVLLTFERHPNLSVPTKLSWTHRLIEYAGAENVTADLSDERSYLYANRERILDWKPDVIIDLAVGNASQATRAEAERYWKETCRNGERVYIVSCPMLGRPGPRLAESAHLLQDLINGK